MDAQAMRDAMACFDEIEDPRVIGRCKHLLTDIVMIALVALIEDASRVSKDHGPENLAILRRLALNLLRMAREEAKASMVKMHVTVHTSN